MEEVVEEDPFEAVPGWGFRVPFQHQRRRSRRHPECVRGRERLPYVMFATNFMFTCSTEIQQTIVIISKNTVEPCRRRSMLAETHEPMFQETLREAGLSPYLFELASVRISVLGSREHPEKATQKSKELIRASVARAIRLEPLYDKSYPVINEGLIIGGGLAGMTAALTIADQGCHVHLVEKSDGLGGFTQNLKFTLEGHSPSRLIRYLIERVAHHPNISVYLNSTLVSHAGHLGTFNGSIQKKDEQIDIRYGAVIVAPAGVRMNPRNIFTDRMIAFSPRWSFQNVFSMIPYGPVNSNELS